MSSESEPAMRDPLIGEVIGGEFEIKEKLGEGGMGAVYMATQKQTERSVAVKVLLRSLYDENLFGRFRQEAQIVSKLSHPGIITIYTYGQHADRTLFIAMELVKGKSLGELLDDAEPFDVDRALPLMIQMADALAYAHEQKIIHRDIKPGNVMITRTGRNESVKVLDFGIAKMLDGNAALTRTGTLCGSPVFMSPEQWHQLRDIDGRTDIYSLGCVFYQMMAGRPPHEADTTIGYMMAHTQQQALPVDDVSNTVSQHPPLGDVIMKCLEIERADRYPDMYALLDALKECEASFLASRRGGANNTAPPPANDKRPAKKPAKHLAETIAKPKGSEPSTGDSLAVSLPDVPISTDSLNDVPAPTRPEPTMTVERSHEGTSAFRLQGGEAKPVQDTAHYILAAVGAVMIALLAVAVFATH